MVPQWKPMFIKNSSKLNVIVINNTEESNLTLSAVCWPPAAAFSWASTFESFSGDGAAATSLTLASALGLLSLESASATESFGRFRDACRKRQRDSWHLLTRTNDAALYLNFTGQCSPLWTPLLFVWFLPSRSFHQWPGLPRPRHCSPLRLLSLSRLCHLLLLNRCPSSMTKGKDEQICKLKKQQQNEF